MKRIVHTVLLYAVFSALATAANIGSQALFISLYNGLYAIPLSILVGTAVGMPVKYVLEKRYIFSFKADNLIHDWKLFMLYGWMGVFTTALFWGIEWFFYVSFETDSMRYFGGVIGLTLGYLIKYHLDKRFVFIRQSVKGVA